MFFVQEIRAKIISILKNNGSEINYNNLRFKIAQVLPDGIYISQGYIELPENKKSEFFELILSRDISSKNSPLTEKTIGYENVLAIVECETHISSMIGTLQKLVNLKKIRNRETVISKKKNLCKEYPSKFELKNTSKPYLLVYLFDKEYEGRNNEASVMDLYNQTSKFKMKELPDEMIVDGKDLWFLNPDLFKKKLNGYEIGWSRREVLNCPQSCYICNKKIIRQHFFYEQLCMSCGDLNYLKRVQTADLSEKIALVSGARVKIGYYVCLRLLRAGAQVIALTRFPHDAALRYLREKDFNDWKDRLHVYGLDFRDIGSVNLFIQFLKNKYSYIDIIINNAAQTVRHPPIYYSHLMDNERKALHELPESTRGLLQGIKDFYEIGNQKLLESNEKYDLVPMMVPKFQKSAELSQIPLSEEDNYEYGETYPKGQYDQYGEQLDLRDFNSWVMRMDDVSVPEILEVQLINQVVPTMFVSKLKTMLKASPHQVKYIVNVSSPEGQFRFDKENRHPHTCMAKAALNMLTFSIAEDYAQDKIFVTCADPGWVTEQFPLKGRSKKNRKFAIDLEDAAARVCDPIFMGENEHKYWRGYFFRHYKKSDW
ncbi:MAG: SDR family oxidoreductase [Candidatus Lokiarchaeota archaeon]|nr:SDR family oxidoreductase [Candidatus Lokiarchaeota archaeon]